MIQNTNIFSAIYGNQGGAESLMQQDNGRWHLQLHNCDAKIGFVVRKQSL